VVAAKLSTSLGQQFVIDNRPGAAGNIAGEAVARAAPDGYTVLVMVAGMTINPALYSKLGYNLKRDFSPIGLIASAPLVLAIHPALPAKSVQELVAYAKSHPGQIKYASSGSGSSPHLSAEIFRMQAGIDIVHVPYKGSPQAVTELLAGELFKQQAKIEMSHVPYKGAGPAAIAILSGEVSLSFSAVSSVAQYIKSARLRALAITSNRRSQDFQTVLTMAEAGVPDS
jgi:tripartite-type tricarboxylate transporter receptor subunit TctC